MPRITLMVHLHPCNLWHPRLYRRLLCGGPAPAAATLIWNSAKCDHDASVGARQATSPGVFGTVTCGVRSDGYLLSGVDQRLVDRPVKTVSNNDVGSWNFERPVHDFTLIVFRVEIDPAVRILFDDLRQFSNQRQRFALIVF